MGNTRTFCPRSPSKSESRNPDDPLCPPPRGWSLANPHFRATKKEKEEKLENIEFQRVINADGTPALCFKCQQGSREDRLMVPCSLCGLNWHIDCLDPPLAIPPVRSWRCPCHVDDINTGIIARLAPAHKLRKVKGAPIKEQAYSRGMPNNGNIEIEEDSDDDELDFTRQGYNDFGRVYRVPEKGIKLDFISRYA